MLNKGIITQKIRMIQDDLLKLKKFKDYSFDKIAGDYYTHKTVERIIEVIVNEAIDINQHIIAKSKDGNLAFDFKETFLELVKLGVYNQEFADKIANSAGLRNILVHQYRKLDEEIFYNSIKDCLGQYTDYCKYILDYLSKVDKKEPRQ